MLYREIMAVCSEIHTKHINTLCGQNVELLNVKLAVRIVTTGLVGLTTVVQFLELRYPSIPSCALHGRYSAPATDTYDCTQYITFNCQTCTVTTLRAGETEESWFCSGLAVSVYLSSQAPR